MKDIADSLDNKEKPSCQKNFEHKDNDKKRCDRQMKPMELINKAVVGIYRTRENGTFLTVNRKLAQIYGFNSPHEFLTSIKDASQLYLNPEDRQVLRRKMNNRGYVNELEFQHRRKDGQSIWTSVSSRVVEKKPGEIVFEGFVTDITKRKLAEKALQESEHRFRMLVEQAGDAFFIHDNVGKIFDVNQQACESLGYSRKDLLGMTIPDIDIEFQKKGHKIHFWETLSRGQYITFDGIHQRKDGRTFPVEVRLGRLDLEGQNLFLSLARDLTERKLAEDRLKSAFKEIQGLKNRLEEENVYLKQEIEIHFKHEEIVGESKAIKKVLNIAEKVAKRNTCVLILGETGTGKELLARAIHKMSNRHGRTMVKVNCATLPSTLMESELFGREKGAFTGATTNQVGRFELAHDSTIFLDEIGDLSQSLQAKLLRVLQDKSFERLGNPKTISVDTRVIAATNQDLAELVREKKFREDLFYRLNVFPITMPPLRERREDIPILVWAFVREFCRSDGKTINHIPQKTMEFLQCYSWPGNIRELRNIIERGVILSNGPVLRIDRLAAEETVVSQESTLEDMERNHIIRVLENTDWRISGKKGAGQILGLKESTLRFKMKKLGIMRPK